jgi:uracil-DNA glycosylase
MQKVPPTFRAGGTFSGTARVNETLPPLEALAWLIDAGAGDAMAETPENRFAIPPKEPAPAAARILPLPQPTPKPAAPKPVAALAGAPGANALAQGARTLEDLKAALETFEGCALKHTAKHTVFADGNPASRILFIGEAPGADEDREGVPFVGRAGRLLDKMLTAAGLDRTKVYITNVLPWRPPGNREPTPDEAAACLPFLRRHIELVDPKLIVLLGAVAARHVMGLSEGILRLRGRWLEYRLGERMVATMPTMHPAYLLRQPSHKKLAWRDMMAIEDRIVNQRLLEPPGKVR